MHRFILLLDKRDKRNADFFSFYATGMKLKTHNTSVQKCGKVTGYIFAYGMFTLILYAVLKTVKTIPDEWSLYHMIAITCPCVLTGLLLKHYLK